MKSYPPWEVVRDGLGEKVTEAISAATVQTRGDLQTYRARFPLWVAQATERGLATWIHDRLWAHLASRLDETPDVALVDREPRREVGVGAHYAIRIKRHHENGRISTYPTQTALDFLIQSPQPPFDDFEQWNLIAGYVWIRETREIGSATISLRNNSKIIWQANIDEGTVTESGISRPVNPVPTPPVIESPHKEDKEEKRSEDGQ